MVKVEVQLEPALRAELGLELVEVLNWEMTLREKEKKGNVQSV